MTVCQAHSTFKVQKNQEIRIFFPQELGGFQEFFSIKSNDSIQNDKLVAAFHPLCKLFLFTF